MQKVSKLYWTYRAMELSGQLIEPFTKAWEELDVRQQVEILAYYQVRQLVEAGEIRE